MGSRYAFRLSTLLRGYVVALAIIALCTVVSMLGAALLQTTGFVLAFPLGVLVAAIRLGVGPAVLTAVGGVLAFDFVYIPPAMAFAIPDRKDGTTVAVMLAVAAVAVMLAEQLRRQVRKAQRQADVESLRNALLSSLSHDLRTPLNALVGAGTALAEDRLAPLERQEFSRMVADEAGRLNRLVGNLLELTRLESGRVTAKPTLQAIDEVIGSALCRLEGRLGPRPVKTDVPQSIPLASFDPILIEQILINLLENVVCHTPDRSPVELSVVADQWGIMVEIADRGPGVLPGEEERVFEKLYRGRRGGRAGSGLGLTICRAIVTAHEGRIWLENRRGGGAAVRFTLPTPGALSCTPSAPLSRATP